MTFEEWWEKHHKNEDGKEIAKQAWEASTKQVIYTCPLCGKRKVITL